MAEKRDAICVVGSSNMDLVTYTDRLPKVGETVVGKDFKLGFGGKGANQAVQAAKLGAKVHMVTRIGDDEFGRTTAENYKRFGIELSHVSVSRGMPTGVAQITVESHGRNSIIIVPGANGALSAADVEAARGAIRSSAVVVCQLECSLAATVAALRLGREEGAFTIMNPAPAPGADWARSPTDVELARQLFELSDLFVPNETELESLTGLSISSIDDAEMAAGRVLEGLALGARGSGPGAVVVTLGERGCLYLQKGRPAAYFPVRRRVEKVVDTTGAGDSFIGSLAFFLARAKSIDPVVISAALEKAVFVASVSVQRPGTQTSFPDNSELPADYFQ